MDADDHVVGAAGFVPITTEDIAVQSDSPLSFTARTLKKYSFPLSRPTNSNCVFVIPVFVLVLSVISKYDFFVAYSIS